MPASPSLRRRRLAAELRRLRDQSGLSTTDAAKKLGWQASRLSRIETRQSGITAPDLRKLLNAYEVEDDGYRAYLGELARRMNERGWWQKYAGLIGTNYADLIGLDVVYAMAKLLFADFNDLRYKPPALLRKMVQQNVLGKKTKLGFYDYRAEPPRANDALRAFAQPGNDSAQPA